MDELQTPDSVLRELVAIRAEAQKGVQAQYEAEIKLARASLALDTAESIALLNAQGNVTDRKATATITTGEQREAQLFAQAEFNRVKTKMKVLEQAQSSVQTQARLIELMYKSAGFGER